MALCNTGCVISLASRCAVPEFLVGMSPALGSAKCALNIVFVKELHFRTPFRHSIRSLR